MGMQAARKRPGRAARGRWHGGVPAADGDDIVTSDPGDLRALAEPPGIHVDLIPI